MSPTQFDAQATNNADQFDKIRELVRSGNKIEAIKIYRGMTNVGLKEAKDAVEALAAGQPVPVPALAAASPALGSDAELMDEIKRLLRQGQKIEAIKIYRGRFNADLAEAKNAVEQMETGSKSSPAPASFGVQEVPAFARPAEPLISPNPFDESEKPSAARRWLMGCSLAALIGLCVAIPVVLMLLGRWPFGQ